MLPELAATLRAALGVQHKRDIQAAARHLPQRCAAGRGAPATVRLGDDTRRDPRRRGLPAARRRGHVAGAGGQRAAASPATSRCMVNVSDIYAMGGRPLAIVDTLFSTERGRRRSRCWLGIADGGRRFGVPVVGGHTNLHSPYPALAVGRAGAGAPPAHQLRRAPGRRAGRRRSTCAARCTARHAVLEREPRGVAGAPARRLRGAARSSPRRACAPPAKDISMGGLVGTTLMLLEASGVGATLSSRRSRDPPGVPVEHLAAGVPELRLPAVGRARRTAHAVLARSRRAASPRRGSGRVDDSRRLTLAAGGRARLVVGSRPSSRSRATAAPRGAKRPTMTAAAVARATRRRTPASSCRPRRAGCASACLTSTRPACRKAGCCVTRAISTGRRSPRRLGVASDDIRGDGDRAAVSDGRRAARALRALAGRRARERRLRVERRGHAVRGRVRARHRRRPRRRRARRRSSC